MKCECCGEFLTDVETRIRFRESGEFANTCLNCLSTMDVKYKLPRDTEEDVLYEAEPDDPPLYDDEEFWDER